MKFKIQKKFMLIFTIVLILLISLIFPTITSAKTIYKSSENNKWITFPDHIKKSWVTSWDGYDLYVGTITKKYSSADLTYKIQYVCVTNEDVDTIQKKSDETPDDEEFRAWLGTWGEKYINEENWVDCNNLKITLECKLGGDIDHQHLIFVKIIDVDGTENIVWDGYRRWIC